MTSKGDPHILFFHCLAFLAMWLGCAVLFLPQREIQSKHKDDIVLYVKVAWQHDCVSLRTGLKGKGCVGLVFLVFVFLLFGSFYLGRGLILDCCCPPLGTSESVGFFFHFHSIYVGNFAMNRNMQASTQQDGCS